MSTKSSKYGPKTKASRGLKRYPRITITLPPELIEKMNKKRKVDETTSALIQRLLDQALGD